ncbi:MULTISPECIES: DNRLRE domain-containing protein [unclassified Lentimonas]|uniref:CBM96 family carbohydrate-binding protein n=1 Tax=unclassified Lentimonas TaxID=2630993 RepID=UPI001325B36F|nr:MULTISPECIES: DNRLRE domain-containing protein [unclassified Lentimonas]CAA6689513.1 Unannotated [Lentimonas sp. CC10]CAA6691974.1 Unannotated [Lentimonas sp. CC19]CAA7070548.1 Unannotated [Lentimonas sp. CC11]
MSQRHHFTVSCLFAYAFSMVALVSTPRDLRAAPPTGSWQLTFEDQFDGSGLDGSKWKVGTHSGGIAGQGGNDPDNIAVADGVLKITATADATTFSGKDFSYGTGEISTFSKFSQQYGYMEARMKWPSVSGLWPAFWTMPDRGNYGNPYAYNHGFLKFDLSSSGISNVTTATLRLKISELNPAVLDEGSSRNILLFRVADDSWSESAVTWNNQPVVDPLYIEQVNGEVGVVGDYIEIDVTEYLDTEISGDQVVSFGLADTFMNAVTVQFHSREATDGASRPQLVIDGVVYEPSEDASVNWGNPDSNYGTQSELLVGDYWGNTAVTSDGGMEFDIMETLGIYGANRISHVLHWDGYDANHKAAGWGRIPVDNTAEFHTYGVYWEAGRIEFYTDGQLTGVYADARAMDVPAFLILSLQLGGWDGNDPSGAVDGQTMEVDYVRVWSGSRTPVAPLNTSIDSEGNVTLGNDFSAYSTQGIKGLNTVSADGSALTIEGNSWIKFPIIHEVTADTVLEFTVDADDVGEIFGIGFEEDDDLTNDLRIFQLAGTATWATGIQESNNYVAKSGPVTYAIHVGAFYTGMMTNLAFAADDDGNASISASFSDIKLATTDGSGDAGYTVDIGGLGKGIAAVDGRTGSGYLMYSADNAYNRFGGNVDNADYLVTVFYKNDLWYADTNYGQTTFTPEPTDLLLASISFSSDTITSLEGSDGIQGGIASGYLSGDLVYLADSWGGATNDGEFEVTGTGFTPNPGVPLPLPASDIDVAPLDNGIAGTVNRYGTGYIMYTQSTVISRFNLRSGNASYLIAVVYTDGQWYIDNGNSLVAFTPEPSDVLLATVDFRNDIVSPLTGLDGFRHGMRAGYLDGDLVFIPNEWAGAAADGQFDVTGGGFRLGLPNRLELYNAWSILQDWAATPMTERALDADPDRDGLSNFVEFAFDLDLLTPGPAPEIELDVLPVPPSQTRSTIRYPKQVEDLSYIVKYSTDLNTWHSDGMSVETIDSLTGTASREYVGGDSEEAMFFRIEFSDTNE